MPDIGGQPPGTQYTALHVLDASIPTNRICSGRGISPALRPRKSLRAAWQGDSARQVSCADRTNILCTSHRSWLFCPIHDQSRHACNVAGSPIFTTGWALGRILVLAPAAPPAGKRGHHRAVPDLSNAPEVRLVLIWVGRYGWPMQMTDDPLEVGAWKRCPSLIPIP